MKDVDISYGTVFSLPHSALWASKIHICLTSKIHSSHSDIAESQPIAASSPESHHLNQVEVRLWVWSILGKNFYLWAWETRKRVMCSQNTVVGHAKYDCHGHSQIQKGGDTRNKCVTGPRQFQNSAEKISQVVMPGSNLLWLGTLPSGPVALASGPKSQFFELSLLFLEG